MNDIFNVIQSNENTIILFLVVVSVFFMLSIVFMYKEILSLKKKNQALFSGKQAKDLEEVIMDQISKISTIQNDISLIKQENNRILEQLSLAVQKVGVVRFNPFGDVGGNQSFAVAFLDNHDSGVIILSLYSRDGVRIYGKPIQDGKSEYKLSSEEEKALELAMKK